MIFRSRLVRLTQQGAPYTEWVDRRLSSPAGKGMSCFMAVASWSRPPAATGSTPVSGRECGGRLPSTPGAAPKRWWDGPGRPSGAGRDMR
ncbi:hypothetical protein GCM10010385_68370 [Streptomyces geysiriensis]|nr:hypothetical protein GCM10010385_68370 [Streptomyces geysiriensis]GGZ60689.1 hypothetical protein GCM10010301_36700 [Streptomyces plicatus]GHC41328.1 hypothetical protein GCM10010308_70500 [Streptomyces vinaceusdrappus]